ncbi:MAG: very short patch repair endonuclease [Acidimicrobiales bacterium]
MRGNRKKDTRPERLLRSELHRMGLRFRKHVAITGLGRTANVDVCFPRQRLAVFIDGCFWHRCPDHGSSPRSNTNYWGPKLAANVERDREVDSALRAVGWRVIRIWEHEPSHQGAVIVAAALRGSG